MPLSLEGCINQARFQRQEDKEILDRLGPEKLKEKLDRKGAVAYAYPGIPSFEEARKIRRELEIDYYWGDEQLRNYYFKFGRTSIFDFLLHTFEGERFQVFGKPFPSNEFEQRLELARISYRKPPVHRLADLTDEQIISFHQRGKFILWYGNSFIDLVK